MLGDAADVLAIDADGALVVPGSGRTVTVLGIPDAVVVDTPDALLVTTRAHAQQVKQVVDLAPRRAATGCCDRPRRPEAPRPAGAAGARRPDRAADRERR